MFCEFVSYVMGTFLIKIDLELGFIYFVEMLKYTNLAS